MGFKKTGPVEIIQVLTIEENPKSVEANIIALEKIKNQEEKKGEQYVQENRQR